MSTSRATGFQVKLYSGLLNNVEIEQVEMTKLLGVTLDCKLSWSKHIDAVVAKMRRGLSIIKRCSDFLTTLSTRQVLQALVSTVLKTGSTRKVLAAQVEWRMEGC